MVHKFLNGLATFYMGVKHFWRPEDFTRRFLRSKGFLCSDYKEFMADLKFYGFDRVTIKRWEFGHEDFVRGQPECLKTMMLKGARRRREFTRANEKAKAKTKQAENRLGQLRI